MTATITDKTYKRLAILVSLNGFSYCCFDTILDKIIKLKSVPLYHFQQSSTIEMLFEDVFRDNPELLSKYDDITIIHSNNLNTFVPKALFDKEFMGSYLQYNTKVFETDFFDFDSIEHYEMNNVYIPYVNMNNFFIDKFGSFEYKHSATVLVSKLLDLSKNNDERKMFVYVNQTHFEIIVVQNQKLLLYNSFDYNTKEDFLYYILFTAEQLQLNPENFKLELLGNITQESELYEIAYTYIRHVSLFDVKNNNTLTFLENRTHFILINS